ncbi:MAG: bifunctional oligoribonuclease/PAP phosphatase NrnA [Syntrophaceae bacterium]|nr:bifunctional oligoribonuclease/PAP phosphatase NrnA [Syntrophaceae bacterium]
MKRTESPLVKKEETILNVFNLKSIVQKNDTVAILMYGSPDPDAVASAMALREILHQTKPLAKCVFVATEPVARHQNEEFIREMKVEIQMLDKIDLEEYRLVALVDCQPTFFGEALGDVKPQIVLDHHPCKTVWHAHLSDVRPTYGSLAAMMTEYLLAARVKISKRLYTALLYGIRSDTNNFEREVSIEDIGAYYLNFQRANRQLVRRIELNQIPDRYLKYFDYAFQHRRRYRDRVVIFLNTVESPDACVQVADFYLRVINIYYVVIAGIVKDKLVIIFRGDGYRQDCGAIARKSFGMHGTAGGHRSAARVEIPLETLKTILEDNLSQETVDKFLVQKLRRKRAGGGKTNGKERQQDS